MNAPRELLLLDDKVRGLSRGEFEERVGRFDGDEKGDVQEREREMKAGKEGLSGREGRREKGRWAGNARRRSGAEESMQRHPSPSAYTAARKIAILYNAEQF